MSKIKAGLLNFYWSALFDLNEFTGRHVTAGELAHNLEISRNTAKKYLDELVEHKVAGRQKDTGKNHQYMILYYAIVPKS